MSDVFVLGAGFSKAIHHRMPTMDELSTEVMSRLNKLDRPVPPTLRKLGNNIELWMTYLSQPQPWLEKHQAYYNQSFVDHIRQLIALIVDDRVSTAAADRPPNWIDSLVQLWHERHAKIITLNYDTLIERAAGRLKIADGLIPLFPELIYPPYFSNIQSRSPTGGRRLVKPQDTFSYLKLHGSTNWYYSGRDDFYGETIFYTDVPPLGEGLAEMDDYLRLLSRDKEALVIPPVTEKTTYFNNETVRRLWRDAGSALAQATRVLILGYSLPVSDLGMRFFLTANQPSPSTPTFIVDINKELPTHYESLLPDLDVRTDFVGQTNAVEDFANQYGSMAG